ncbi:MAG TPA: LuxR C-terminal-related transcriptional regulator [Bacillales bacterium]|nr:LuxR C-terminal-related transcriptional regulator [Bacillales bacterium]
MNTDVLYKKEGAGKFGGRLTIVTAPAGFGKTTLVNEWCRRQPFPSAWIDVKSGDQIDDPFRKKLSDAIEAAIGFPNPKKDMDHRNPAVLVLDNVHFLENKAVSRLIKHLFNWTPPSIRIVIISRHQLSLSEAAVEITEEDLRFNEDQSRCFFENRIGRDLREEEFANLHQWAQGWPGGMQLLSLIVEDYGGIRQWIVHFQGEHQYLSDYLSEIWDHEPPKVRDFLLQTAVVKTFDVSSCEALFGKGGKNHLQKVIDRHLMISSTVYGYRYEPLFQAFLLRELRMGNEEERRKYYRNAAKWYAEEGRGIEAVDCILKAGNAKESASLILRFAPELLREARWEAVERWGWLMGRLQGEEKGRLMFFYCWVYFLKGAFAGLDELIQRTEEQIDRSGLPDAYRGELRLLRSFTGFAIKDVEGAGTYIDDAFSLLKDGNVYFDTEVILNRSEAQLLRGPVGLRGRMSKVSRYLSKFREHRGSIPETFAGYANTVGAEVAYEANQKEEARKIVKEALDVADKQKNASMLVPAAILYSRILSTKKAFREGLSFINEVREMVNGKERLWQLLLAAQEIRLYLAMGQVREAERLLYENILHTKNGAGQLHEFESLTYVRVLIAGKSYDQAELLLEQLLFTAESEDRYGTRIEILVLQSVIFQKTNRIQKGMEMIKEALALGCEEGYVRIFLNEGQPIHILLGRIGSGYSAYVKQLLDLFREAAKISFGGPRLTKRELDIIGMMGAGFTNKEMAEEINVTIGTVKGYASTLFRKLDVRNRTQAVARAQELDLLRNQGKNA